MNSQNEVAVAAAKVGTVSTLAGVAWIESATQWAQFGAATIAILYGGVQLFFLLRDKWWRER